MTFRSFAVLEGTAYVAKVDINGGISTIGRYQTQKEGEKYANLWLHKMKGEPVGLDIFSDDERRVQAYQSKLNENTKVSTKSTNINHSRSRYRAERVRNRSSRQEVR